MVFSLHFVKGIGAVMTTAMLLSLIPLSADAQRASSSRPAGGAGGGNAAAFCENIDDMRDKALARVGEKKAGADRSGEYESKRTERLAELDSNRTSRESEREERYETLRANAETDAQSEAVETFITTVEDLADERKEAVDAAIADFEDAVEELMEDRDGAVDDYADEVEEMLNDIFDDAEAACDDDTDPSEVRTQLREDMTAMRETIKADREEYSFGDELDAARAVRKAAIEAAVADFTAGLEAAKTDLKEAFGEA